MSGALPQAIAGLAEITDRFDAFLIDQFGVLRDATGPYAGAPEALASLKAAGKRIVILSNSGKRSAENDRRLAKLGFDPASWDWFLTSGEVAFTLLSAEVARLPAGRRCLLISRDGDTSPIEGLAIEQATSGADADFILLAASEGDRYPLSHYEALLAPAAARGVECLCTNPDKIMLSTQGTVYGAGRIAELYEALGGPVRWIGKPFADIYTTALTFLGHPDGARVCCIGDSIEHDIAGAKGAGLASLLVTTGILADLDEPARAALYDAHHAAPDFICPTFRW